MMRRIVCVVEGYGEVEAIPNLCARILGHVQAREWVVDQEPIRQPRGKLVDESGKPPNRQCKAEGISRALDLAMARMPDAVVVLCDSDGDCPKHWYVSICDALKGRGKAAGVMAVQEYESWLLFSLNPDQLAEAGVKDPDVVRNPKSVLKKYVKGYKETTHQLLLTRRIQISKLENESQSFAKFVRVIRSLTST